MGRNKKSEERSQESGAWLYFLLSALRFTLPSLRFLLSAFCFLLLSCSNKKDSSPKFSQYYNQGETLYQKNCSNCHQKNGSGLGLVYPPLDSSDYMEKNFTDVICLIRHGKEGELIVNGKNFNQPMPGIPTLTDLEIAEIATYIYNTWSHQRGLVEVREVSELLKACPD
jgi:cytochrome c551